MKERRCRSGQHEYEKAPFRVDAGYLQGPDGSRIDGRWLRFRCERCHHTTDRWEPENADPQEAGGANLNGPWTLRDEVATARRPAAGSFWERPLVIWILVLVVAALAAYGYYWDSRVRTSAPFTHEIIKPRTTD
jgi:anti-sigma factor RsiW